MDLKLFVFVVLVCMLVHTPKEVDSHEFLKDAYNSVKNAVVKGYHHVAHIFVNHDHDEEEKKVEKVEEKKAEKIEEKAENVPLETLIDVRFKEIKQEDGSSISLRFDEANEEELSTTTVKDDEDVPDLNNRFFINAPCAGGLRKKNTGCRQVIHN